MSTKNTFEINSEPILDSAEGLVLAIIKRLKSIARRLVNNPTELVRITEEIARLERNLKAYLDKTKDWVDDNLSDAYLRGIGSAGSGTVVGGFATLGILSQDGGGGGISDKAKRILKDFPEHWTAYRVFQNSAYDSFAQSRLPIVRDINDKIRELIVQASETSYRDADTFTRAKFSQELLNRFADEGVDGIRYADGRIMKLDTYTEMVARTQTKNAWNQASFNRLQEYGMDLVVISVHYPCSPLCVPHQGKVFSISGTSTEYPSLQGAIDSGLYHPNCKHTASGFREDRPTTPITRERNEEMYEAQNMQRYNERQIRHWKRRELGSITKEEGVKAKKKVAEWQSRNRELIDKNTFLRRKYAREAI